jgi:hypothetical protein
LNQGIKIGAGLDNYEKENNTNLMGYDYSNGTQLEKIPLYYVYKSVNESVFHVKNPGASFSIGSGNDNQFCGHLSWPCKTIEKAILQSGSSNTQKVGLID